MFEMRKITISILLLCSFILLSDGNSYAVDPSVLYGRWESRGNKQNIIISIESKNEVTVFINEKRLESARLFLCYCGEPRVYPIVAISASVRDEKHYFNLVMGTHPPSLRGFYEVSKLIDSQKEVVSIKTNKLDLLKTSDKP